VLAKHAPAKLLLVIVGLLISTISAYNIWKVLQ
jgi:hypothetical protein